MITKQLGARRQIVAEHINTVKWRIRKTSDYTYFSGCVHEPCIFQFNSGAHV